MTGKYALVILFAFLNLATVLRAGNDQAITTDQITDKFLPILSITDISLSFTRTFEEYNNDSVVHTVTADTDLAISGEKYYYSQKISDSLDKSKSVKQTIFSFNGKRYQSLSPPGFLTVTRDSKKLGFHGLAANPLSMVYSFLIANDDYTKSNSALGFLTLSDFKNQLKKDKSSITPLSNGNLMWKYQTVDSYNAVIDYEVTLDRQFMPVSWTVSSSIGAKAKGQVLEYVSLKNLPLKFPKSLLIEDYGPTGKLESKTAFKCNDLNDEVYKKPLDRTFNISPATAQMVTDVDLDTVLKNPTNALNLEKKDTK